MMRETAKEKKQTVILQGNFGLLCTYKKMQTQKLRLEVVIVSDIICPWCYMGFLRVQAALDQLIKQDALWRDFVEAEYAVVYRGWILLNFGNDIDAVKSKREFYLKRFQNNENKVENMISLLTFEGQKCGTSEEITFNFSHEAKTGSSLRAHALINLISDKKKNNQYKQEVVMAVINDLFVSYHTLGIEPSSKNNLLQICSKHSVSSDLVNQAMNIPPSELRSMIDEGVADMNLDLIRATGVPHFVFNFRDESKDVLFTMQVGGAQDIEYFVLSLKRFLNKNFVMNKL